MSALLLGIDIGTSVIKSILFDAAGREIAGAARENVLLHPTPGMVEQNMTAVWQAAAETAAEAVVSVQGAADEIVAIGVTGQGDGTWLVDAEGRPVGNAVTWLDGRVGDLVEAAHTGGLSEQVFARTGTALNTSNQALQLRWLAEHEPDRLARAHAALRAKDWIFLCLTGQFATDESDASHTYFSVGTRALDPGLPGLLGIGQWTRLLPPIRAATENQAPLLADAALRLGLRPGTPVVAGPFDVAAADLGSGVFQPGDACTILGTAAIHQMVMDRPADEPKNTGYTMCHAPADRLVRLLPSMTGALNLEWFLRQFYALEAARPGVNIYALAEEEAATVPPGCDGVLYHPYINPAGERSPFVRPDARAQFSGMTVEHSRAALLRSVYEGVLFSAMDCYEYLNQPIRALTLAGGGARSDLWCQMFADGLDCPVTVVAGNEQGALGAAINAGVAVGLYASYADAIDACVRSNRTYAPNPQVGAVYRSLLPLYRQTYKALFPVWQARAQWRREHSL
ncbi:MAG: carbohydrate kinase [Caldilineaceae bacterium]|nr:carbohydrate kinase [Caldilineaceae bacterium]